MWAIGAGVVAAEPRAVATTSGRDEAAIRSLIASYAKSIDDADTKLASTVWAATPDVSFIHPRGHEHGWAAIKANVYERTMGEGFSDRTLTVKDVVVSCSGDAAWAEFYWDFSAKLRTDGSPVATHGRETQIYRKLGGRWRLVHVHYSALPAAAAPDPASPPVAEHRTESGSAERATGIGGVFFKARDPKTLGAWYRDKLGIAMMAPDQQFSIFRWREREDSERVGSTAWALFPSASTYFAPSQATFMIDYRVRDLDRMLAQLRAQGVDVESKVTEDFNGRFAWVVDPEGNKIELWEPKAGH